MRSRPIDVMRVFPNWQYGDSVSAQIYPPQMKTPDHIRRECTRIIINLKRIKKIAPICVNAYACGCVLWFIHILLPPGKIERKNFFNVKTSIPTFFTGFESTHSADAEKLSFINKTVDAI